MDPRTVGRHALALIAMCSAHLHAETRGVVSASADDDDRLSLHLVPATAAHGLARSRILYLSHDGVDLRPGDNDSRANTSSIITSPVTVPAWETTPELWAETVACVKAIYAPFAVTITDIDPGEVPHLEAVFGGSPLTLGLPRNISGISPFSRDCGVIENSIVFTFTEILPRDARSACHVMVHEIAHSFGLDHELHATDPMSYRQHRGDRAFVDEDTSCGDTSARPCGFEGDTCRASQNSYQLLAERLGLMGETAPPDLDAPAPVEDEVGCDVGGGGGGATLGLVLVVLIVPWRRRALNDARVAREPPRGSPAARSRRAR